MTLVTLYTLDKSQDFSGWISLVDISDPGLSIMFIVLMVIVNFFLRERLRELKILRFNGPLFTYTYKHKGEPKRSKL